MYHTDQQPDICNGAGGGGAEPEESTGSVLWSVGAEGATDADSLFLEVHW